MAYDEAGTKPATGPQPGTQALRRLVGELFPGIVDGGVYDLRDVCGNRVQLDGTGRKCALSLHAEGRAVDAMVSAFTHEELGDRVAAWAVEHHEALHIQEVIWNKEIWTVPKPRWSKYTGRSNHTDHVHIGQDRVGAKNAKVVEEWRGAGPASAPRPVRMSMRSPGSTVPDLAGIDAHFSAMRYPGKPVVLGAKGDPVNAIQWKLNKLAGCTFTCDGDFSAAVERAVRDFQAFCKVPGGVDGKVGRNTWKALELAP